MDKRDKLMRAADGGIVFMLCLLQMGILGSLLMEFMGVYVILLCEVLTVCLTVGAARLTRLKTSAYLKLTPPDVRQICGASLLYASALLAAIPLILFGHLLLPNFAVSGFHIANCRGYSIPMFLLILLVSALSETVLFEGYLYSRFRYLPGAFTRILLISGIFAIYHLEMALLLPLFVVEIFLLIIRERTGSMLIPFVLHFLTGLLSLSLMQAASPEEALMGAEMGGLQVSGLALIFLGAAIPVLICGNLLLRGKKKATPLFTVILLAAALVLVALGCGISGMGAQ
ncbi:MAG: lysostaphin resistance A-like protein [Eubacteriales bacterium]